MAKSISDALPNRSMSSFTSFSIGASSARIRWGANNGSIILRYFLWSGGSISIGMSGRSVPI